jgi:peptidoglycan/xylan/chitin deacetylase (PgdA/CDA1 family)
MTAESPPHATGFHWPAGLRAAACFTFDVDAESVILWDHPETAAYLDVMTHQEYDTRVAVPRLLRLLEGKGIRATFFVPGYTAERWPDAVRSIRDAGHEIAHHGYLHEGARGVPVDEQERRLVRGLEALEGVLGVRAVGYRAPSWEVGWELPSLLARHGFRWDSSLMAYDRPYHLAVSGQPDAATLTEIPVHWSLDDWQPYNYLPGLSGTGVILSPTVVIERWARELDALADEGGLFMLTMHPFVSGRASRAAGLGELIDRAKSTDGLWIATCGELAAWVESLELAPVFHEPPMMPGR